MLRLALGLANTCVTPLAVTLPDSGRHASRRPLRIRIRGSSRQCFIEWKVLEALVQLAQQSDLGVDVECVTADGASMRMSLV